MKKMLSSGAAPTKATQSLGFVSHSRVTTPKRVKIAKATARLINRFLPDHKIVVFTK